MQESVASFDSMYDGNRQFMDQVERQPSSCRANGPSFLLRPIGGFGCNCCGDPTDWPQCEVRKLCRDAEIQGLHSDMRYLDFRSERKAKNRSHNQKCKGIREDKTKAKRQTPSAFWKSSRCCEICARQQRKSTIERKYHGRQNRKRFTVDREILLDHHNHWYWWMGVQGLSGKYWWTWEVRSPTSLKPSWKDDCDDYWEWMERSWDSEEAFIERWFNDEHEFKEITNPWESWWPCSGEVELQREAAIRAWLGMATDDFWVSVMDEERERKQVEKYHYYYEKMPCWVGQKHYDLTPLPSRRKQQGTRKYSIVPKVVSDSVNQTECESLTTRLNQTIAKSLFSFWYTSSAT